ncbi:hypothetical protein F444_01728 [Phytophthora nicotianae P1976]|uniref:EF-hand domain-containing protein n=1 Tax=Phytophthora nicotianae P1976 TaxID=1317066 RepID=A0A081AZP3_PHYNI|nr:hypothetical protein F444_01728 [Phytophthora nicotianae P1976]
MDNRASTAPTPKRKIWLPKQTSEASSLLRHSSTNSDVSVLVDRPHTCPTSSLIPQFHWNLNNSALETLTASQIEQLYGLFKFYDSSIIGDTLPSISCTRLQEILRDAHLLSDHYTNSAEKKLDDEFVERVFAQAVMGKMRVYLDADGQPALTFPLFCGALMNCAMLLSPLSRPAIALQEILSVLLSVDDNAASTAKGLLRHVPLGGSTSLWTPEQSQIPQTEDANQDFREQFAFQQVIADCTRDKKLEELKQEKLREIYHIPDRLVASFHPDTLELIMSKFRMFDFNDCGTIPRQELFSLLSCLGMRVDLPDPYTVLSKLPNIVSVQRSGNNSDVNSGELTLVQLLQVIEVAREAKRHSATSKLAAIKVRVDRAATVAKGSIVPTKAPLEGAGDDVSSTNDRSVQSRKASAGTKSTHGSAASSRDRGRRQAVVPLKSRKSILSGLDANTISQSLSSTKHQSSKTHLNHQHSKKKTGMRKKSTMTNDNLDSAIVDSDNEGSVIHTQRSGATTRTNTKCTEDSHLDNTKVSGDNDDRGLQLEYVPRGMTVQVCEPLSTSNKRMIRIFLLLGGEHDGAIYCTFSLVFSTRKIEESEGIYYSTAQSETTRTTPVLPTQHTLIHALLMLKKCVLAKLEQGYELRPADQLDIVDKILQEQRNRQPHCYSPVAKTSTVTIASVPASPAPDSRCNIRLMSSSTSACSSRSSLRPQKLPPHSKPSEHRFNLPSNFKEVFATWEVSKHENYAWIHDVNAASPLKPALSTPKAGRSGLLSPLRPPLR